MLIVQDANVARALNYFAIEMLLQAMSQKSTLTSYPAYHRWRVDMVYGAAPPARTVYGYRHAFNRNGGESK